MSVLKNTIGFGRTVAVAALVLGLLFVGISASAQGLGDFIRRNVLWKCPLWL